MRIKELREQNKIKQKDIAFALGIARNTFSQYETGARQPDLETIKDIADFFSVTVDYLLGYTDQGPSFSFPAGEALSAGAMEAARAYEKASDDDRAVVDAVLRKYKADIPMPIAARSGENEVRYITKKQEASALKERAKAVKKSVDENRNL